MGDSRTWLIDGSNREGSSPTLFRETSAEYSSTREFVDWGG